MRHSCVRKVLFWDRSGAGRDANPPADGFSPTHTHGSVVFICEMIFFLAKDRNFWQCCHLKMSAFKIWKKKKIRYITHIIRYRFLLSNNPFFILGGYSGKIGALFCSLFHWNLPLVYHKFVVVPPVVSLDETFFLINKKTNTTLGPHRDKFLAGVHTLSCWTNGRRTQIVGAFISSVATCRGRCPWAKCQPGP